MSSTRDTFALALQRRQSRELSEAERLFRQVVQADPSYMEAWRELGLTCLDMNKLAEAEESFRQAVRLAPGMPPRTATWESRWRSRKSWIRRS